MPKAPWDITNPTNRPWVAALDYAVQWAAGATDTEQIATMITEEINSGPSGRTLKYDSPTTSVPPDRLGGGYPNYGLRNGGGLRLANFILFLNGGANPVRLRAQDTHPVFGLIVNPDNVVNCSDTATLKVAFSSVLGTPLVLTQLNQAHSCNEILAIGREGDGWIRPFQRADGSGGFGYHAFAGMNNLIWDACLKVGGGDPTIGGTRTSTNLPSGMPRKIANPASNTVPVPIGPIAANGTVSIDRLYDDIGANGVVPHAGAIVECIAIAGGNATFHIDCGRNGSMNLSVPNVAGETNSGTLTKSGVNILDITITQGTALFAVGHRMSFDLHYDFSEYRSSLAAPDWDKMDGVRLGRTPATTFTPYPIMEVE